MKYKLDLEEEYDFEGWAFLHFHTAMPGYAFADSLNRLYDLGLERIDDMELDGIAWPFYIYDDPQHRGLYFMVERPAASSTAPWEASDKVLVVGGENADTIVKRLYSDITDNTPVDEADLLAREHAALRDELLADFTVANILDFDTPPVSRRATKDRQTVQRCCDAILAHIEQNHLDLSQAERMRLEMLR